MTQKRRRRLPDDPIPLAEVLAQEYLQTGPPDVIRTLLRQAGRWDAIARSCWIYPTFEKRVGRHFPILWIEDSTEEELKRS